LTIILTGGGSGGHITPVLAVASELKKKEPKTKIIYFGQKGDRFAKIVGDDPCVDKLILVRAGKFRRFHGEGIKQVFNLPVMFKNIRDLFYIAIGTVQSTLAIKRLKPDVLFSRGGYVSVPVALGAKFNHVPYMTHDSDPIPSLANRIIAPWAALHLVALPKEIYPYPQDKTVTTGIPLSSNFVPVSAELKQKYREQIKIPKSAKVLFVIGGGLGSTTLNSAVVKAASSLLKEFPDLRILHVAGQTNETALRSQYETGLTEEEQGSVQVFGFISDVYKYSGAADVIISRAGATNLAEFAIQGKAVVIVPSAFLTGGHQVKNAEYLMKKNAAIMMSDNDLNELNEQVSRLLQDNKLRNSLSRNLSQFGINDAAQKIADITLGLGREHEAKT
jgi:UDP-N-acetylglucosamine--N-acetylmuramyl-(pentapeptide) pyrophosphoryl-undecaprenol N-acetylglucosamine transferase